MDQGRIHTISNNRCAPMLGSCKDFTGLPESSPFQVPLPTVRCMRVSVELIVLCWVKK
ncbi:hypothetical protein RchiOBHm_Chr0c11g0499341 [Rosa chinensis]|uniref:Uncharacterized protein n=1 Tax=Rosa chinensis TaxID=74649 RepID=A0A2P6SQP3_ROSCH|nr:hypothetical protein RchiOBHm_Chr0c11g0499341 [Rosa chinensis]